MNKIFKMNKIVLHANLVNRVNRVNPVQSNFNPHAACSLNGQGGNPLNPLSVLRVPSLENSRSGECPADGRNKFRLQRPPDSVAHFHSSVGAPQVHG